jgi:hypothetical protein
VWYNGSREGYRVPEGEPDVVRRIVIEWYPPSEGNMSQPTPSQFDTDLGTLQTTYDAWNVANEAVVAANAALEPLVAPLQSAIAAVEADIAALDLPPEVVGSVQSKLTEVKSKLGG